LLHFEAKYSFQMFFLPWLKLVLSLNQDLSSKLKFHTYIPMRRQFMTSPCWVMCRAAGSRSPLLLVMPLYEADTQWKDANKNREEPSTQKQNSVEVEHQFRTSPPLPLEKFSEFCNLRISPILASILVTISNGTSLTKSLHCLGLRTYSDGLLLSCWWRDPLLFTLASAGYDN
jgi:hypothetical protein